MNWLQKCLVALLVVFLHFASQLKYLTNPSSRYDLLWTRHQGGALLLAMFGLGLGVGLLALGVGALARRVGRPGLERLLAHVFVAAVVSGVLAIVPSLVGLTVDSYAVRLAWLAAAAGIGYSLAKPRSPLPRLAAKFCLVLSPAPFIMAAQVLCWSPWATDAGEHIAAPKAGNAGPPVFVIVFDEWSYWRSTTDGRFRPFFRNVRALCERAVCFRRALAPYHYTRQSVPRLMFQNDRRAEIGRGYLYWRDGVPPVRLDATPGLFQAAKEQGYHTAVLGWILPYKSILGRQLDYCRVWGAYPRSERLLEEMGYATLRNLPFWTDPIARRYARPTIGRLENAFRHRASAELQQHTLELVRQCPPNTLALVHAFPPHPPDIWHEDGTLCLHHRRFCSPEGYERSLRFLDRYIGELIDCLRGSGKLDDALLILTSDHAWRDDHEPMVRAEAEWARHVPLIIKLPGQTSPATIDDIFCTNKLAPLFHAVFRGERDTGRLLAIVRQTVASNRLSKAAPPPN